MTERRRSEVPYGTLGFKPAPRENAPAEDFQLGYEACADDLKVKLREELATWKRDGGGYDSGVRAGLMIALEFLGDE